MTINTYCAKHNESGWCVQCFSDKTKQESIFSNCCNEPHLPEAIACKQCGTPMLLTDTYVYDQYHGDPKWKLRTRILDVIKRHACHGNYFGLYKFITSVWTGIAPPADVTKIVEKLIEKKIIQIIYYGSPEATEGEKVGFIQMYEV